MAMTRSRAVLLAITVVSTLSLAALADNNDTGWPSYGRDFTNQRFSPLQHITPANVSQLRLAWRYRTGVAQPFEASPIVIGDVMYVSLPLNHVVALDARTGAKRWQYTHAFAKTVHCCGPVNRGVAVADGRVYMGTLDAKLIALNADTGARVWEAQVDDNTRGYSITGAPLAVNGLVITGVSGGEYGIRGHISAYDGATGQMRWRWHTIPSPEEGGWEGRWAATDPFGVSLNRNIAAERAAADEFRHGWKTGGGPVWQTPAYDPKLGLLIFTVGNPSPDLDDSQRPGDNLYSDSIVALDLNGKLKWHFQQVPHDVWDLDPASPVVLVDVPNNNGDIVPAVAQAGKTGWVYVLDRRTGRAIRRSEPFVPQENLFAPLAEGKPVRIAPGAMGGSEWSPTAWNPALGYLFVSGIHMPMHYLAREEPLEVPAEWWGGVISGAPDKGKPAGIFSAVDLKTGRIVWRHETTRPLVGGALATASGLVFTGTSDKEFLALDAVTGKVLWRFAANAGVNAPPVTYAIGGQQYVAVAAGGNWVVNSPIGDEVLVFTLGERSP